MKKLTFFLPLFLSYLLSGCFENLNTEKQKSNVKSIIGEDDRKKITKIPPSIEKTVGSLVTFGARRCTAFIISPFEIITASHCYKDVLWGSYTFKNSQGEYKVFHAPERIHELDLVILPILHKNAGNNSGSSQDKANKYPIGTPVFTEFLKLAEYNPQGSPLEIYSHTDTFELLHTKEHSSTPIYSTPNALIHSMDTEFGSSGSPIFQNGKVVAIHIGTKRYVVVENKGNIFHFPINIAIKVRADFLETYEEITVDDVHDENLISDIIKEDNKEVSHVHPSLLPKPGSKVDSKVKVGDTVVYVNNKNETFTAKIEDIGTHNGAPMAFIDTDTIRRAPKDIQGKPGVVTTYNKEGNGNSGNSKSNKGSSGKKTPGYRTYQACNKACRAQRTNDRMGDTIEDREGINGNNGNGTGSTGGDGKSEPKLHPVCTESSKKKKPPHDPGDRISSFIKHADRCGEPRTESSKTANERFFETANEGC